MSHVDYLYRQVHCAISPRGHQSHFCRWGGSENDLSEFYVSMARHIFNRLLSRHTNTLYPWTITRAVLSCDSSKVNRLIMKHPNLTRFLLPNFCVKVIQVLWGILTLYKPGLYSTNVNKRLCSESSRMYHNSVVILLIHIKTFNSRIPQLKPFKSMSFTCPLYFVKQVLSIHLISV